MSYIGNEPIVSTTRTVTEAVATAGQTTFYPSGGYTVGYLDVNVNGSQLQSNDFTATNGTSVVLVSPCIAGDEIRMRAYGTFSVAIIDGNNLVNGSVSTAKLAAGAATLAKLDTTGTTSYVMTAQGSGNAPVWAAPAASGSMTLLGTLATTSGASQVLSGLTLTGYKFLFCTLDNVSIVATSPLYITGYQAAGSITTVTNGWAGSITIDLGTGTFTTTITNVATGNAASGASPLAGRIPITTASTSITFSVSATTFDAGSIKVYGVI